MKQWYKYPDATEITYYIFKHKRIDGSIAHDFKDPDSIFEKFQFEPCISKQHIDWLNDQLDKDGILKYIYKVHKNIWIKRVKHGQ